MSEELKACPFCGGKAELLTMRSKGVEVYGVFCRADLDQEYQHGHFIDNYGTKAEAIAAWNRRDVGVAIRTIVDAVMNNALERRRSSS